MPYTLAHPAFIIPLRKFKRFSITALIIGSIAPDLSYFVTLNFDWGHTTHYTWFGMVINIVIGLIAFLYWHLIGSKIFGKLIEARERSDDLSKPNQNITLSNSLIQTTKILLSLIIGILSHLFIDNFTHTEGYFVAGSILSSTFEIAGFNLYYYSILQYSLSVVGLIFILFSWVKYYRIIASLRILATILVISILIEVIALLTLDLRLLIIVSVLPVTSFFVACHFTFLPEIFRNMIRNRISMGKE